MDMIGDALYAGLGNRPGVQLVERDALTLILREQRVSLSGAVAPEQAVAVGRIAGADWLLTVTPQDGKLGLRLVRTRDGAVRLEEALTARRDPFLSAAEIRQRVLRAFRPSPDLAERLTVGITAFVNRSGTSRNDAFNGTLQIALRERLRAEPWATVLERQYPTALLDEADLARLGLSQGAKDDLPPADLLIMGSMEDATNEYSARVALGVKLDVLVRLRSATAPLTLTCRADRPDRAAQAILAKVNDLRRDPAFQTTGLTEKEFWCRHALYLTPRSSAADGRTVWDTGGARERADSLEAVRAWENVLLLDARELRARLQLGVALVSLYSRQARQTALPLGSNDAQSRYAVQQTLRGTHLVEDVVRADPCRQNAATYYHVACAGISYATSGALYTYSPERSTEMFRYIVANPTVFRDWETEQAEACLRRLSPDGTNAPVEEALAVTDKDTAKAAQLLKEFFNPGRPDAEARLPVARQYAESPNALVRFHAQSFVGRMLLQKKDRTSLDHYDRAIAALEEAQELLKRKPSGRARMLARELDSVFRKRFVVCEVLNLTDEARRSLSMAMDYYARTKRTHGEAAWAFHHAVTKLFDVRQDAAAGPLFR